MAHYNTFKYKRRTYRPCYIDSLESHSTTVAKTVAKDFESNCVCEDKAVFKMVAEEGFEPPTFGL